MKSLFFSSFLLFLLACGGGGGSSEVVEVTPPVSTTVIDEDNAVEIIEAAFTSFDQVDGIEDFLIDVPQSVNRLQLNSFNRSKIISNNLLSIVYCGDDPETDTGHGSIDITISGNFVTTLNILAQFMMCELVTDLIADGDFELDFVGVGDIGPDIAEGINTVSETFTDLSISNTVENVSVNLDGNTVTVMEYAAPVFSWSNTTNMALDAPTGSLTFTDWQRNLAFDIESNQLAVNIDGTYVASTFESGFTFEMIEPLIFEAVLIQEEVEASLLLSGKFKITATDSTSVTVTILDPTQAQLEIDTNGDGTTDITIIVLISDLGIFDSVG